MVKIASRGPKPTAALRELKVPIHVNVPEPSTWRELTQKLEQDFAASLPSLRVAVQEYGTSNPDLLSWLTARCEAVTRVAVYQWALPEDIQPLRECVVGLVEGLVDVVLFTTSIQIVHLFEVARQMGCEEVLRTNLAATAIFSIGPTTTEELKRRGLTPELEPAHPKMGFLVNEAAQHANSLLQQRRNNGLSGPRTGPSATSRPASQRAEPGPAGSARAAAPVNQPVAGEIATFLHEIGRRMAAADPIHTVLQRIVEFVLAVIPCDSCFIYVLEREELVLRASKNPHADLVDHLGIRLGQGITGWVAEHREPVAITSKAMHDRRFKIFKDLPEDQFEALLSCPIVCANRVVGVMNLQHRRPYHHKPEQIRLLSMIGFLVGAEIERARLEDEQRSAGGSSRNAQSGGRGKRNSAASPGDRRGRSVPDDDPGKAVKGVSRCGRSRKRSLWERIYGALETNRRRVDRIYPTRRDNAEEAWCRRRDSNPHTLASTWT